MLTEQEKRVLIAKAQGFTVRYNSGKDLFELIDPSGNWKHPYDADGSEYHCWNYSPDYFHDLNAMSEAEKVLTSEQRVTYSECLKEMIGVRENPQLLYWNPFNLLSATSSQRAEAFGLTLKLWTQTL